MTRSVCLGLLLSTTLSFAQPVEGPYQVLESDLDIHHIYVAARNDSIADIFYQIGNEAYHAAMRLTDGEMYSGPTSLPNPNHWTQTVRSACSSEGIWHIVTYDQNDGYNRTTVLSGEDTLVSTNTVDSDVNPQWPDWAGSINHGISIIRNLEEDTQ